MNLIYFVQYFHLSTGYSGPKKTIHRLGSDGVMELDGRLHLSNMRIRAEEEAKRRGKDICGYEIHHGTFMNSTVVGKFKFI